MRIIFSKKGTSGSSKIYVPLNLSYRSKQHCFEFLAISLSMQPKFEFSIELVDFFICKGQTEVLIKIQDNCLADKQPSFLQEEVTK